MKSRLTRITDMYERFSMGEYIFKKNEVERFDIGNRSFDRDIAMLRCMLAERPELGKELLYDHKSNGYKFNKPDPNKLSLGEIFIICKILLESRALIKSEMYPIIQKIIFHALPAKDHKIIESLISNEMDNYVELQHKKPLISITWDLCSAVYEHSRVWMTYKSLNRKEPSEKLVEPVGIMFSEFYFYMLAFAENRGDGEGSDENKSLIAYRVDRIRDYKVLKDKFYVPYAEKFSESEFRKRVTFMHPGRLQTFTFWTKEKSLEAILDKIQSAEVIGEREGEFLISAEVFGNGITMWLRAQGNSVRIVVP